MSTTPYFPTNKFKKDSRKHKHLFHTQENFEHLDHMYWNIKKNSSYGHIRHYFLPQTVYMFCRGICRS